MGNNGRAAANHFIPEAGNARYHARLLGVLAVLVEREVWQDALVIADLLEQTAPEVISKEN